MSDEIKPAKSPEGILVNIKEKLNKKLFLTNTKMKTLIEKFVRENMHLTGSKVHFTRVTTYNEFVATKMTIKVFFKYLHIIGAENVEFIVKVRIREGLEAEVSEHFNLKQQSYNPYPHKLTPETKDD